MIHGPAPPDGAESLSERASYLAFAAVERMAMALPEFAGRRLFDLGAVAAFHAVPKARRVVAGNLARVLGREPESPVVRAATKEAFRSYGRYWYDTFHVRALPDEEFRSRHRTAGVEHLQTALDAGRGAVLALPHMGNWDAGGKWVHLSGWGITAVAENLRPRRLYELFRDHRHSLGMGIVALADDRKVGQELIRLLGQNEVIALVADRDLKGTGVEVEMFGETRRMPAGPALLSLATGSPLLPCSCYDLEDGWILYIEPPLEIDRSGVMREDVVALTRLLARRFERSIAAAPTQWHMFQPAWPDGPPARSAAAGAGAAAP